LANDLGRQDRIIRLPTIVDLPVHAREVGPIGLTGGECATVRLVLASHLIATVAAQE
jgi:hypothetical protein